MGIEAGTIGSAVLLSGLMFGATVSVAAAAPSAAGSTRIACWRDDKVAAFLLMFDDGEPTHLDHAIPELKKRGLIGTFYLNPGATWYQARRKEWETDALAAGMVFANHTMLHHGAKDAAEAEAGIAPCNAYLLGILPDPDKPRLLSYCTPGGTEWKVPKEEMDRLMAKYHLVPRPKSDGRFAGVHLKTAAQLLQVVDQAATKTNGYDGLFFHGVGGDWLSQPTEDFVAVLDRLVAVRERLWVTDPISLHQYETERQAARVTVVSREGRALRLRLEVAADPQFYNLPLTLITQVPEAWRVVQVRQQGRSTRAVASEGVIRYDATPNAGDLEIIPE